MHSSNSLPHKSQEESVSALADLALRCSGADGYALYTLDRSNGALVRRSGSGFPLPQPQDLTVNRRMILRNQTIVISYPLLIGGSLIGMLAFSFREEAISEGQSGRLDRMARAIETVYCLPHAAAELFTRVNRLETELTAAKIAPRVAGFLDSASQDQAVEVVERHVASVLRSSRLQPALEKLLREGEKEIDERALTERAKALLQKNHGMSEEQAHLHLRMASRRSRRVAEIARELIAGGPRHSAAQLKEIQIENE